MASPNNPFHIEAVATYGVSVRSCENLGYMNRSLDELHNYLKGYPVAERRYGGAIGLRGGHGSGKTHLLNWIGEKAKELRHSQPTTLYGKADSANLFDLYKQIVSQLERPKLLELLDLAVRNIAIEHVKAAKVTESIQARIAGSDDLTRLYEEANLDREQIMNSLQVSLEQIQVPTSISRTMLTIASPGVGEQAYHWLLGDEIQDLSALGIAYNLRQLAEESAGSSAPDVAAVDALEAIAGLHRLAGVPLIILVDQLEVLLRTDTARQETLFSVIKKLIEHLQRQQTLLFVAGSDEAWRKLPRDVPPRLRLREPLQVGNLSLEETTLFLQSYCGNLPCFAPDAVENVHKLSGGNPREIIRVAYHAFEKTHGNLSSATYDILLQSAKDSGSVATQNDLALLTADSVLKQYGTIAQNLAIGDGVIIDRLVKDGVVPFLALVTIRATDKLSEVNVARSVKVTREYLEHEWPGTVLFVVAIGYSSEEIRKLLGLTAFTLQFNEANFASQLETEVAKIAAHHEITKQASTEPDPKVLALLERISKRLDGIESRRQEESKEVQDRFNESTAKLAEPERKNRELKTRWEILEELDRLDDALRSGWTTNERDIIRAILVANEAYLKDTFVDQIGGLYLDLVSIANRAAPESEVRTQAQFLRAEMIAGIRSRLRRTPLLRRWVRDNGTVSIVFGVLLAVSYYVYFVRDSEFLFSSKYLVYALPFMLAIGFIAGGFVYAMLSLLGPVRRWNRHVRRLRHALTLEAPQGIQK